MPKIKIKAKAQATGFEAYGGAQPTRPGPYRGVVKQIRWREYAKGSQGFNVLVELLASEDTPDKAKFDGAPFWRNIVAVAAPDEQMKDGSQRSLDTFLAAINAGDDPDILTEDGDAKNAVNVTRVGTRTSAQIIGTVVVVDLRVDSRNSTDEQTLLEINNIRPSGESPAAEKWADEVDVAEDDEDEPAEDEDDEADEDAPSPEEREAELKKMGVKDLRSLAQSDYDLTTTGLAKAALIDAILDHEYGVAEPAVLEDEEDDEEADEDEVEVEEDEAEEDDEDEADEYADRQAELNDLDRVALKAILKTLPSDKTVFKSTKDEDIRTWILELEFPEGGSGLPF